MSKDFSSDQGGIQSSDSTIFPLAEGPLPKSGIAEAPTEALVDFGPGPGIGNSRRGIH